MFLAAAVPVILAVLLQPLSTGTEPQQEPDTDLSLGRIYQDHSRNLLAESSRPSGSRRPDTELHMWSSTSSVNDESLNLHLGTTERQTELEREARIKQIGKLREDLRQYYDSSWESWPNAHITQGRYQIYVPTIKKRAMAAFLLRDKYKDIIDAKGSGTVWPLETYRRWHDSLPDRAPVGRTVDRIDDESNEAYRRDIVAHRKSYRAGSTGRQPKDPVEVLPFALILTLVICKRHSYVKSGWKGLEGCETIYVATLT
ncbi:hypothetical protein PHSY_007331 [Pseudozyma hubeiensis SY62]|uniref:Uncharacterized protein n=1 Tax=Pseudozyma hubeiensis (strain SY62) TaxID=1305764 RepID=R9PED4_PSEHS|nr:hypothetical protein PHSY_007331 [Pseudozyma hubeiensis SY62]GAC99728.1 hypothetical protein PHSY_007331 [Pseudozyma hubeiensis SY62]